MPQKILHNDKFDTPLSQEAKVRLGLDSASFMKRMKARLSKIRGNDDGDEAENFLVRHNYYKYNTRLV